MEPAASGEGARSLQTKRNARHIMHVFISILFWAGVLFLADGSLGLVFEEKWKRLARGLNIRRLALIEIGFALTLLAAHFLLRP